jgi:endo-1,4-beta-xylanase
MGSEHLPTRAELAENIANLIACATDFQARGDLVNHSLSRGFTLCPLVFLAGVALVAGRASGGDTSADASLREAAKGRFLVGAAVMSRQLDDPKVAELVARQFDCLTGENEFKPASVHPRPDQFRFEPADRIIDFAKKHDMKVVGHTLCWHSQSPAWMFRGDDGKPLSREAALANLKTHIDAVVGHFRGKVIGWDVVNEAISDSGETDLRDTPARRAIGDDFIEKAFELAHAADPDAELYYNDYSNDEPRKLEKTLRLIRALKAKGVRLDAVGMQSHLRVDDAEAPNRLEKAITAYSAEGVKVLITELDVDVLPRNVRGADVAARQQGGADPYKDGLPTEVAEKEARFYGQLFEVVLKNPGVVTRVTFWGTHDGASWLNNWPVARRTNYPLLFDRKLEPKPAFQSVIGVLSEP